MKYCYFKIVLAFCLFFSMNAFADVITIGSLKYELNGSEAFVSGYEGNPTDVTIPATIEEDGLTFKVTKIKEGAFTNCKSITSVTAIGDNLGYILNNYSGGAFAGCTSLVSISFPNIIQIDGASFQGCSNLKYVWLGYNLKRIGGGNYGKYSSYDSRNGAFEDCSKLPYIVVPASCTLSSRAFTGCSRLQSIVYLGDQSSTCGSNTNVYNVSNMVNWSKTSFVYTGNSQSATFNSNLPNTFQLTSDTSVNNLEKNVGTYEKTVNVTFSNSEIEFSADIPYKYTITPITLKAKVADASREYGDANPEFTSTYTGFVNNEDACVLTSHGAFATTAKATSDVGTYAIKQTGATAQNYVFEYEDGKLTINKAPLTMTANNKTITYGNKLPSFDVTYTGLKNNETKPKWTKTPTITSTATADSDAGSYPIEINDADATNYTLTTANGTLTINKAALSIKADNKNKLYGETNPELTCSYVGFVKNQTDAVLNSKPQLSTTATTNSTAGVYPIEVSGAEATNYSISYQNAELTINKRELSVTANNYTRAYGEENPEFELTYQGFVNNEDESVLKAKPVATTSATSTSDVGEYSIIVGNGVADNYNFQYINGKLTIEKAYQTLTWDQDFSDVKINDLIELTAEASSGLEITYSIESGQGNRIWKSQNKQYLECIEAGEVVIVAIQKGNKNYRESNKIYKTIVIYGPTNIINGHEYVDLGLTSGKLWARTNLGASLETQYGTYVKWSSNDIVTKNWGEDWGTPGRTDYEELINTCKWTWKTKDGVAGYEVTGPSGKSIFFPAAGFNMMGITPQSVGSGIYYYTKDMSSEASFAYMLSGSSSSVTANVTFNIDYMNAPIRPIVITKTSDVKSFVNEESGSSLDVYDLNGTKKAQMHKGLNIIRMSNGKTKKVLIK